MITSNTLQTSLTMQAVEWQLMALPFVTLKPPGFKIACQNTHDAKRAKCQRLSRGRKRSQVHVNFSWPGPPGTWPLHVSPPPEQRDRQKSGAMQGPVGSICLCQAALHQMITERELFPCNYNTLFYTRSHKARGECSQRPGSAVFAISSPTQRSSSRGATALQSLGTAAFKQCHKSLFKQTKTIS